MSRIWKLPVNVPADVNVNITDKTIVVKWPKWELSYTFPEQVNVVNSDNIITVSVVSDEFKNLWGLVRSLIFNMVVWVTQWYSKKLIVIWVWYNVKLEWKKLVLNLWYSHPIDYPLPDWISANVEKDPKGNTILTIEWINNQIVWQVAANIRSLRLPEPYKGKWVRYEWEVIKLKAWKTAKK